MSALGAPYSPDPRDPSDPSARGVGAGRVPPASAVPSAPEAPAAPRAPEKRRGRGRLLLVLAAAVAVMAAGAFVLVPRLSHPPYSPGDPVPKGRVVPLGTLTVNTSGGHLVQAGLDLQMTAAADLKTESSDRPALLNAAIQDFGHWSYGQLITPHGRKGLQRQLLASFQRVLGTVDGGVEQVSAVYFTGFVVQ